jgi:hypothetical protein
MMTRIFVSGLLIVMVLGLAAASAQVPDMVNYQGVLTASDGSPIDTTVQMMFRIYADSTTSTYLWTETHGSVNVDGGMFNVLLGSGTSIPDSVFEGSVRYLGLTVGTDSEMTPRRPLVSVGYAFKSERSDTAEYALTGAADNDWVIQGDTIYHVPGNVGIGTASPTEKLDVTGNIHASGTIRSGNSITVDGVNDKITATSGKIDFDDEDLVTTGKVGIGTTSPDVRTELHVVDSGSGIAPTEYYGQAVGVFESYHTPTIQLLGPDGGCIYFGHSSSGFAADGGIYYSPSYLSRGFLFRTGGNYNRMVIDSSGKVGIGTTSPGEALDVIGNLQTSGVVRVGGNIVELNPGFVAGNLRYQSNQLSLFGGMSGVSLRDAGGNIKVVMLSNGDVGVGTTSPSDKLHVNGGSLRISGGGNGVYFPDGSFQTSAGVGSATSVSNSLDAVITGDADANGSGGVKLRTGSNDRLTILNGGNVGIGTATPTTSLEVAGTVYSTSGGFKFPDGTVQTTAGAGGGLASIDSVFNTGGNVDLIPQNAVTITPNDGANTITIGETHSALTSNPHAVTAAQTGALVSVDGVSNPGGNVNLVAGPNITITPDDGGDSIVFSATASYAQVFIVAATGGNFTTIGQALNACTTPSSGNTYLIRVMPGTYNETITCSSFVRLQGAGKYVCFITGTVTGADSCTIDGFNIVGGILCPGTSPTISNNLITNGGGDGVLATNGGTPWIVKNEIRYCLGWGIHCNGWNTDAWIIANRIEHNGAGGIRCTDSAPTISNNQILSNQSFGIYLVGNMGTPSEPTIDDNVIGRTQPPGSGVGIYMIDYAEPRIYANDIWINYTGIEIHPNTQPSILANNLSYNQQFGIRCFSSGASKPVVIKGNHIHSHNTAGLDVVSSAPIVTHNNIHSNPGVDIQYDATSAPVVSLNVFDNVNGAGTAGLYNVTTLGLAIAP